MNSIKTFSTFINESADNIIDKKIYGKLLSLIKKDNKDKFQELLETEVLSKNDSVVNMKHGDREHNILIAALIFRASAITEYLMGLGMKADEGLMEKGDSALKYLFEGKAASSDNILEGDGSAVNSILDVINSGMGIKKFFGTPSKGYFKKLDFNFNPRDGSVEFDKTVLDKIDSAIPGRKRNYVFEMSKVFSNKYFELLEENKPLNKLFDEEVLTYYDKKIFFTTMFSIKSKFKDPEKTKDMFESWCEEVGNPIKKIIEI